MPLSPSIALNCVVKMNRNMFMVLIGMVTVQNVSTPSQILYNYILSKQLSLTSSTAYYNNNINDGRRYRTVKLSTGRNRNPEHKMLTLLSKK